MKRSISVALIAAALCLSALTLIPTVTLAQSTPTATPTSTPTPASIVATVVRNANLRAGPGTTFAVVGNARAGDQLIMVGQNAAASWYELDTGAWIAAFLVNVEPSPAVTIPPAGQAAQVTNIVDGDTIDVRINGETYRLRYILIDTPERGQPFAAEATEANRRLVAGKTIYLVKDVSETDRYGRLLRYVYLADGTFVNAELVRQGYAQIATFPPDVAKEAEIRAAQRQAVEAERGLWAAGAAATPTRRLATATPSARTAAPTPTPTASATSPTTTAGGLRIIALDKREEYTDIVNDGATAVDLAGWMLRSERGKQDCPLHGVIEPGQTLRIWAMERDAERGGFNCGFGSQIWNNSEYDPAVLFAPDGVEVSRYH
ncbi:MAG: thermonuclease family protein [Caldilineaceae bacterium]|nr:thermonuclease family protein [Caldilineaceae bacterium]